MKLIQLDKKYEEAKKKNFEDTLECLKDSAKYLTISYHPYADDKYQVCASGFTGPEAIYVTEWLKFALYDGALDHLFWNNTTEDHNKSA